MPNKSWRDVLPVHPAAELFPMMSPDELKALGESIRKHGLLSRIVFCLAPDGKTKALLDGRNRLDAMELMGRKLINDRGSLELDTMLEQTGIADAADPYAYVIAANIHRRHLTAEQKRELIAKILKAQPEKSNRAISKQIKADDKTVGSVRRELERRAEIPHVSTVEDTKGRQQPAHKAAVSAIADRAEERSRQTQRIAEQIQAAAQAVAMPKPPDTEHGEETEAERPKVARYSVQEWKALAEPDRKRIIAEASGQSQFNAQENDSIEWARWSWNPVTGCLHDCKYCYARDIADRFYEQGFEPTFLPNRLAAPSNTKVPKQALAEIGFRNVFVCSMADLFGKWVPEDWIDAVFDRVRTHPQWNFLFLTKFPQRLAEREWPANAWCGTTVDTQARVKIAERAFRDVKAGVKWLSVEPMMERLTFTSLEMFNWIVIGGATRSTQTPAFDPPMEWVLHLLQQAHAAGIDSVYAKANLRALRGYPQAGIDVSPSAAPPQPSVPADDGLDVPAFLNRRATAEGAA